MEVPIKIYVDPYTFEEAIKDLSEEEKTLERLRYDPALKYKGSSAADAGAFYCPYVPLQTYGYSGSFAPKTKFKTRYDSE